MMLVSVIIPCHNCASTIDRAVDSVFSQTYQNWELILVNNNSTDITWKKLNEIKNLNPERKITILDEKKKGAPATRNKGLHAAKGEWIQFLDSDDELLPKKIEKQLSIVSENVNIVYSPYKRINELNNKKEIVDKEISEDYWEALILSKMGITSANLFRRKAVLAVNGWSENLTSSQEYDLMFRISKKTGIAIPYNTPLAYIHDQENSISNEKSKILERFKNFAVLRSKILEHLKLNEKYSFYKNTYNNALEFNAFKTFRDFPFKTILIYNSYSKENFLSGFKKNLLLMISLFK
ncbi:glycosyltransferase family 2 protein [Chryseobacterium sp. FH1]|uniref:glycosyltransferase family 2 protein n=1 Tax=Chryseobacterium sp. FH1 TaxID=1233951 RepID=UPI0009DEE876|nr:glycosyltransferase family 2 protein [Chryseobacterium sp. FH1]